LKEKQAMEKPAGASHAPAGLGAASATQPGSKGLISRVWKWHRRARWVILGVVLVLAIIRLILPFAIKRYVNHQLNTTQDYGGRIGDIHVQLWRGRYRVDQVNIFKRNGAVRAPLFSAAGVYLALEWRELFHGSVVGQVIMKQPHLNFVAGPTAAESQTGKDESWDTLLSSLFPFDLNRFEIDQGQIHFQNDHSTPPVDIYLKQLSATATNLTNSRKVKGELPAGITAHGTTLGGGGLDLQVQLNPMAKTPSYQVVAQLTNVDLTALNSFLRAYGKFDVDRGQFALYTSVASKDGNYDGYLKVFFHNLKVFAWEKERQKNALEVFWEAIVGTLTAAFKNHATDTLATRVPISGSYNNEKIGTWTAVGTLLRNAFIRALIPKLDEKVTLQHVEKKAEDKKKLENSPPPGKGAQTLAKPGG
jgi:hypothetical protein